MLKPFCIAAVAGLTVAIVASAQTVPCEKWMNPDCAEPGKGRTWFEQQTSPTRVAGWDAGNGFSLTDVWGCRLTVCAEDGGGPAGLLATGTLQAMYTEPSSKNVSRNPSMDFTVTSGSNCQTFQDIFVQTRFGRAGWVANGIAVDGGNGKLDIYANCTTIVPP